MTDRVRMLSISSLHNDSYTQETQYSREELAKLIDSISIHGLIVPLSVRKRNGKYEVVSGIRRWKAAKYAGLKKVPVANELVWAEIRQDNITLEVDHSYDLTDGKFCDKDKSVYEVIFRDAIEKDYHSIEIPLRMP